MKKTILLSLLALLALQDAGLAKAVRLNGFRKGGGRQGSHPAGGKRYARCHRQFPRFAFMVDSLRALYPDMLLVTAATPDGKPH